MIPQHADKAAGKVQTQNYGLVEIEKTFLLKHDIRFAEKLKGRQLRDERYRVFGYDFSSKSLSKNAVSEYNLPTPEVLDITLSKIHTTRERFPLIELENPPIDYLGGAIVNSRGEVCGIFDQYFFGIETPGATK